MNNNYLKTTIHILLIIATVVMVITGYGITKYQTVEKITFGLLDKGSSFQLHSAITIPFIILVVIHIFSTLRRRK